MTDKHLHIVSFNIPFPADYGGVIDIYYKIKTLKEAGVKVILHCFEYGRSEAKTLDDLCEKVYYYPRNKKWYYIFNPLPFIVLSRNSEALIENILKDNHPLLFEGLHSCFFLNDKRLKGRIKMVRTHNIEHDYYSALARSEKKAFKKLYFKMEAYKLKKFEEVLKNADYILAISPEDSSALSARYKNVIHLPPFHAFENVSSETGSGTYVLYHGNLEIGENNKAALFLVKEVFEDFNVQLIIAGNGPSKELKEETKNRKNIKLIPDVSTGEIEMLVKNAHINVLPTFQSTGIKLKLLTALYNGRHCLVNSLMVNNTGLEELCTIKNTAEGLKSAVTGLMEIPFVEAEKEKRRKVLSEKFSNTNNIKRLLKLLE